MSQNVLQTVADPEISEKGGGGRNMKYKPPRTAAIFSIMTILTVREGGGYGPLAPPWIRYCPLPPHSGPATDIDLCETA